MVPDFVPNHQLSFQTGSMAKLRTYKGSHDLFGMGQEDMVKSAFDKISEAVRKYAVMLIVVGGLIGVVGTIPLEGNPFGPVLTAAGGFIMAAGLVPVIVGSI